MTFDMRITTRPTIAQATRERGRRYAQSTAGKAKRAKRHRAYRAATLPEFIGVDSEGIGRGKNHRAVLLGVGQEHFIASDMRRGLDWKETFEFLYKQFEAHPRAAFVGFYLGYDFNNWLRFLPRQAAWMLLTKEGMRLRRMKQKQPRQRQYHPVRLDGWEIDILGFKRLSIRPRPAGCNCHAERIKCTHKQLPWMHICDAGSFYQMPFIKVIDPATWEHDPDGPVCTQAQFERIREGKDKRANFTRITKQMIAYNAEENALLSVVMTRLAKGFASVGIRPSKDEWYGPGSTASKWLRQKGAVRRQELADLMPQYFSDACRKSYFGGWFEIFSHGLIMGKTYNYDINNAYPFASTKLPHICGECSYKRGSGDYKGNGRFVLLYVTVFSKGNRIGAVPYRDKTGAILRPAISKGWYWRSELLAAQRAGLIKKTMDYEWVEFIPCDHEDPLSEIADLYKLRLSVGKNSAQGMAIKLNNNSVYGKFAQSVGSAPYNNWLYASYITSHCRTQILDAIATHPNGAESVLMVATDGICFDSPHPSLPISKRLGEWEESVYMDLCLFKPGVYWHHEGKENLLKVKSRGVPKAEFAEGIQDVEALFANMQIYHQAPGHVINEIDVGIYGTPAQYIGLVKSWPWFEVPIKFRMKSCKQALNEGQWDRAAEVQEEVMVAQSSDPQSKRQRPRFNEEKQRIDTIIHELPIKELETKYYGEVKYPALQDPGYGFDGSAMSDILEAFGLLRDKPANYDIDIEWETIWDGGPVGTNGADLSTASLP
jgi:DNA polymerase type B, organellar and viral